MLRLWPDPAGHWPLLEDIAEHDLLAPTIQSSNRSDMCKSTSLKQYRSAQRIQPKMSEVESLPEAETLIGLKQYRSQHFMQTIPDISRYAC
jgi:hypothetical protein